MESEYSIKELRPRAGMTREYSERELIKKYGMDGINIALNRVATENNEDNQTRMLVLKNDMSLRNCIWFIVASFVHQNTPNSPKYVYIFV